MAWLIAFLLLFSMEGWLIRAVEYKLDGESYIVYSTSARTFSKTYSTIHMLFRTAEPSGILLHARGTNGDFITLEIVRGKLRYASVFGQGSARPGFHDVIVGDDLGDDQWHQIDIERNRNHVVIKLDITRKYLTADRVQKYQNINQDITVAALQPSNPINSSTPQVSLTGSIFKGCMEDVSFNKNNIFTATKAKSKYVRVLGNLRPKCADDAEYYPAATLTKSTSFIKVALVSGQEVDLGFKFRTFDHSGVIVHYSFGSNEIGTVFLELVQGKLRVNYGGHINSNTTKIIATKYSTFADGLWHNVRFNLTGKRVAIRVNNDTTKTFLNVSGIRDFFKNPTLKIGTSYADKSSMKGCVRKIQLNGKDIEVTRSISQDVDLDQCYLKDLCLINPCLHQGVCKQHNNAMRCDCTNTDYQGLRCENISNSANYNTASTQYSSSRVNTKSSSILTTVIRPSETTAEVIKTTSSSIKLGSSRGPSTSSTSKLPITLPFASKHFQQKLPMIRPSQTTKVTNTISRSATPGFSRSPSASSTEKLPSSSKPEAIHTTRSINPKFLRKSSTSSEKISAIKPNQSSIPKHTPTALDKEIMTPSLPSKRIITARSNQDTTLITKHASSPQLKQLSITTQTPPTSTTKSRSNTPPRLTLPTSQKPTYQINTQIIIIEKSNTINTGYNKNQLLVYLFLFLVFMLFVGLIIIISVKLSSAQACSCFRRHQTDNGSLTNRDAIELGQQDAKESSRGVNQRRVKSGRPSSLNDSGIDRSESGTDSHRSSAEMQDEAVSNCAVLETRIEDASSEGFLILQEGPPLYTQQSFGWTVLDSSSTIRHCRTSTRDLIHAVNENKPRAFRSAYYPNSREDDVIDDVTVTSETRSRNRYQQLATSDCSSLDNESVDFEPGGSQEQRYCGETREEC